MKRIISDHNRYRAANGKCQSRLRGNELRGAATAATATVAANRIRILLLPPAARLATSQSNIGKTFPHLPAKTSRASRKGPAARELPVWLGPGGKSQQVFAASGARGAKPTRLPPHRMGGDVCLGWKGAAPSVVSAPVG